MKKFFPALVILCICQHSAAQVSAPHKPIFHSISAVGLQNGSNGSSLSLQSIGGVSVKHSFGGIGVGLDWYKLGSIPLFVDLRHELGRKRRNLFLYGDIGYNLPWLTDQQKEQHRYNNDKFTGALYWDAGLGYSTRFNTDALLLSLGYSYKEQKSLVNSFICGNSCSVVPQTTRYHMPRIVLKAGWRF